ncbi:protein-export chaperone SecB [Aliikangiella maris]|uniref:Protein-export chaperone SecB n=2 Tax=Aliikangiella maris TaxID=3162458 RepID=A0ABV2BYT3_9GAMM
MTDQVDQNAEVAGNEENAPQFAIQRIYVKDISFEAPNLPEMFSVEYKPEVKMEMNSKSRQVAEDHFEVVLSVTLSAEIAEKTAFLVEVQQAGLFFIKNFNEQQTHQLLGAAAPEALYPYVREVVSSLIGKTGFPPIQLAPVNFMGLYMERMQQAQQEQAAVESSGSETVQ